MAMWLAEERLEVDQMIEAFGNIPGELIRFWAKLIKPAENFVGAYVSVWKNLGDEEAVRGWQAINRWVEDVIPFAGGAFRQFVVDYVRGNELIQGHHEIGGRRVDLSNIRAALLNIIAQFDHLVAPSQSETIIHLVSSRDKKLRVVPSTHVGIMASARARYKLWPEVVEWLGPRSRHDAGAPNRTLVG
jgi:polyhydroxyalkanoate synthase